MDIKELRRKAADHLKWDEATLHQKIGEVVEIAESVRRRLDEPGTVPTDELRVVANEITRRTAFIDLCREKFPAHGHRIDIVLSIGDTWVNRIGSILQTRRLKGNSSTRRIIQQGFDFLSPQTRDHMLQEFDSAAEEVASKRGVPKLTPTNEDLNKK